MCGDLHNLFNKMDRFDYRFDKSKIPENGIYIVFEKGETAHGVDRIVRVGTHTGENQLKSRLSQHLTKENKDRSIFRKNIGRAILNKEKSPFILEQWNIDLTTLKAREKFKGRINQEMIKQIEHKVTRYMQENLSFAVFEVKQKEDRLFLESKIIATVSLCRKNEPSRGWLGLNSPEPKIRKSGLWLVNELYKEPLSAADLEELKRLTTHYYKH